MQFENSGAALRLLENPPPATAIPRNCYPLFSRKWDCDSGIPDLSGKVALVTGGNVGLGFVTARELLKHNAKVYIACRSEARAKDAIARLTAEVPAAEGAVFFLPFDLTDLKSAEAAAQELLQKESRLDILVANAAIMAFPYEVKNGVEWNHLGHYALIQPLLPLLIKTSKEPGSHVRIVNVSSLGHTTSPKPDFSSLETVNRMMGNTWARYGHSKLANVLYTLALQKHLSATNIRCLCLHPGLVNTELTRGPIASWGWLGHLMAWLSSYIAMTPFEGAKTQIWAATSPEVDEQDLKAAYLIPIANVGKASAYGRDPVLAEQLWKLSEEIVRKLS